MRSRHLMESPEFRRYTPIFAEAPRDVGERGVGDMHAKSPSTKLREHCGWLRPHRSSVCWFENWEPGPHTLRPRRMAMRPWAQVLVLIRGLRGRCRCQTRPGIWPEATDVDPTLARIGAGALLGLRYGAACEALLARRPGAAGASLGRRLGREGTAGPPLLGRPIAWHSRSSVCCFGRPMPERTAPLGPRCHIRPSTDNIEKEVRK